jgi:hypothetical protein
MTAATNSDRMTGTRDEQFDLISALYHALESASTCEAYCQDAERTGDNELRQFFEEVKEQNRQCAERAKSLLAQRLAR